MFVLVFCVYADCVTGIVIYNYVKPKIKCLAACESSSFLYSENKWWPGLSSYKNDNNKKEVCMTSWTERLLSENANSNLVTRTIDVKPGISWSTMLYASILCFVILLFVNYDNNSWKSSDENLFLCELFHAIYIYICRYLNVQQYSGSSEGWHFLFKYTGIITLMHLKNTFLRTCPASC